MREIFFLSLLLFKTSSALSVYEPYPSQKNTSYKDGLQTVELTIQNLEDYRDPYLFDDDEYYTEDILNSQLSSDNIADTDYFVHQVQEDDANDKTDAFENDDEIELEPFVEGTEIIPDPPNHRETAKMSRYVCHYSDWLAMATISTRGSLSGTPFANIFSYSDGTMDKSTGIPYFYLTNMDMSTKDLQKNPQASVTISLAQSGYCRAHSLDPEDPRCAHVILAGDVIKVGANSTEEQFAKEALFTRHPVMSDWPESHGWFFAKLNISNVILLDFFGGAIDIPVQEYFDVVL